MSRFLEDDEILFDDNDEQPERIEQPKRLISGINLKDLASGTDVVFKINEEYEDKTDVCEDLGSDLDNNVEISTSEKLRAKRGAPEPNTTFASIAASMTSLDPEGYVKKEIITYGSGVPPPDYSRVLVHYNFYKEFDEEPFDSTYLRGRPCRLRLSQGEIIPGLEIALKSMKKNENSRFLIKWEVAFGSQGCPPRIGKECDILADVTLLDYTEIMASGDSNALTEDEMNTIGFGQAVNEAKNIHCEGNEEFAAGNIKAAARNYRKCIKMLNELRLANEEEEEKMLSLKVKSLVNLAICCNKMGKSEFACIACRDALSIDPNNVKATFQYGRANLQLSNLKEAEKWLIKAKRMKPDDEDINKELDRLQQKKKATELQDAIFCQRAFRKMNINESKAKETAKDNSDTKVEEATN